MTKPMHMPLPLSINLDVVEQLDMLDATLAPSAPPPYEWPDEEDEDDEQPGPSFAWEW